MNQQKRFFLLGLLPILLVAVSLYLGGLGGCGGGSGGGGGGGGGGDDGGGDSPTGTDLSDVDGTTSATNAALSSAQGSITGSISSMSNMGALSVGALRLKSQEGELPDDCTDDGTQTCCPAGDEGTCCVDNADAAAGNISGTCTFTCAGGVGTWTQTFTSEGNEATFEGTLDSCPIEACGETVVCSGSTSGSFSFGEDGSASGSITTGACGTGGLQCVSPDGETHSIDFTISFSGSAATGPSSFSGELCIDDEEPETFDDPREFFTSVCAGGEDYGDCIETCESEQASVEGESGGMDCASQCDSGHDQFGSCMEDCVGENGDNCEAMEDGEEKWDCFDGCFEGCDMGSDAFVDCWNTCAEENGCTSLTSVEELTACVEQNCSDRCSGGASQTGTCYGGCIEEGGSEEDCSQICNGAAGLWEICFDECMGMEGADSATCMEECDTAFHEEDEQIFGCLDECFTAGGTEEECVEACVPDDGGGGGEGCTIEQVDVCKDAVIEAETMGLTGAISATDCVEASTGMCAIDCSQTVDEATCLAMAGSDENVTCDGSICTWLPPSES